MIWKGGLGIPGGLLAGIVVGLWARSDAASIRRDGQCRGPGHSARAGNRSVGQLVQPRAVRSAHRSAVGARGQRRAHHRRRLPGRHHCSTRRSCTRCCGTWPLPGAARYRPPLAGAPATVVGDVPDGLRHRPLLGRGSAHRSGRSSGGLRWNQWVGARHGGGGAVPAAHPSGARRRTAGRRRPSSTTSTTPRTIPSRRTSRMPSTRPSTLPRMSNPTTDAAADNDVVLYEVRPPGIALITLNRPERLNAWNGPLAARYFELLDQAAGDPAVKVIVVTGAGRGFCAGADMDSLQAIGASSGAGGAESAAGGRPQSYTTTVPKPVIAAVNGALRRHRHGAGAHVRHALRCCRGEVHHGVQPPWPDRRVRHVVDPAAAHRHRPLARPAHVGSGHPGRGGRGDGDGERGRGARAPDGPGDGVRRRLSP